MLEKAVEKLQKARDGYDDGDMMPKVIEYLAERCRQDPSMAEDVAHEKKTVAGCEKYLRSLAIKRVKERVGGQAVYVDDGVVYEWAEDYFRQDPAKMKDAPNTAARKEPEKAQKTTEKAESGPKAVETVMEEKKPAEAPKAPDRDADMKPRKKPQKKKDEVEGQMSLFDFMGAM